MQSVLDGLQLAYTHHCPVSITTMYNTFFGTVARYDDMCVDVELNREGYVVVPTDMIIKINVRIESGTDTKTM